MRRRADAGFSSIAVLLGLSLTLFTISFTLNQLASQSVRSHQRRASEIEGLYATESAVVAAYVREKMGVGPSGVADAQGRYTLTISSLQETWTDANRVIASAPEENSPVPYSTTRDIGPSSELIRRHTGSNVFFSTKDSSGRRCGYVDYPGKAERFQLCLADAPTPGGGGEDDDDDDPDNCRDIQPLPSTTLTMTEMYTFRGTGSYSAYQHSIATPLVGRLSPGDDSPSIIATMFTAMSEYISVPAKIFAVDGATGTTRWVSSMTAYPAAPPALGNIDGDDALEVVLIGADRYLYALSATGAQKWKSSETVTLAGGLWPQSLAMADLDLDGTVEIVAGNKVFRGSDGTLKFNLAGTFYGTALADVDGQPGIEIIGNNGIYNGSTGAKVCSFSPAITFSSAGRAAATDDHGTVFGNHGGTIVTFNGKTCAKEKTINKPDGNGPANLGDYDGDGVLDFGIAGSAKYVAISLSKGVLWTQTAHDFSSASTGSTSFDFNGDGRTEIVYADEQFVRVYDGPTGRVVFQAPHTSATAHETPAIADVDGDGTANILVAGNRGQYRGIRVFKAPNNEWVNTREIWNQHAYNPLLVKEDGSLTNINAAHIFRPWFPDDHLLGFRNNVPQPRNRPNCP